VSSKGLEFTLNLLPTSDAQLQALHLKDSREGPLPLTLLEDLPVVADSLKFLKWEVEKEILYRLCREDGN